MQRTHNPSSIQTRIKTPQNAEIRRQSPYLTTPLPFKQGLRQGTHAHTCLPSVNLTTPLPFKQGLRHSPAPLPYKCRELTTPLPFKQGLRRTLTAHSAQLMLPHNPSSIQTRIKTVLLQHCICLFRYSHNPSSIQTRIKTVSCGRFGLDTTAHNPSSIQTRIKTLQFP